MLFEAAVKMLAIMSELLSLSNYLGINLIAKRLGTGVFLTLVGAQASTNIITLSPLLII